MTLLLDEFAEVFEEPHGLPPSRRCDHHIHLFPGTAPVAIRPYRYPQLLKDEIKCQCDEMLTQGIIGAVGSQERRILAFLHRLSSTQCQDSEK